MDWSETMTECSPEDWVLSDNGFFSQPYVDMKTLVVLGQVLGQINSDGVYVWLAGELFYPFTVVIFKLFGSSVH